MEPEITGKYPHKRILACCFCLCYIAARDAGIAGRTWIIQPVWAYFIEIPASVAELLADKVVAATGIFRVIYDFDVVSCGHFYTRSCINCFYSFHIFSSLSVMSAAF